MSIDIIDDLVYIFKSMNTQLRYDFRENMIVLDSTSVADNLP